MIIAAIPWISSSALQSLSLRPASPTRPSLPRASATKSLPSLNLHRSKQSLLSSKPSNLAAVLLHSAAALASIEAPSALAVTGVNSELDVTTTLIQGGIVAFIYFIVAPPIIMNWMRVRWYKRKFLEMYLQFMFTFIFFPGLLLWAPFLNFRKFPRDPTMKYPWSTPKEDTPLCKSR